MGIFDFLGKYCVCDGVRPASASRFFGKVKCQKRGLRSFRRGLCRPCQSRLEKRRKASAQSRPRSGNFDPGENRLEVRYRIFSVWRETYAGDRRTLWRTNDHFSLLLVPTGRRVSFARDRIRNLGEVEQWLVAITRRRAERHVLNYHRKKGTTSPLFQKLRQKYPNY